MKGVHVYLSMSVYLNEYGIVFVDSHLLASLELINNFLFFGPVNLNSV